jgi:hypothetical protein
MRRVLLDHCVPRRVRTALPECDVATAYERGWSGLKNGALLDAAEAAGFEVLVTADKNLRYQQHLASRQIAIVELPANALPRLIPLFPALAAVVKRAAPGSYHEIPSN